MKLCKIIVVMVLFGSIFVSASEEKKPWATVSYTKTKPNFEDRVFDVGMGTTLLGTGVVGNMTWKDLAAEIPSTSFERTALYRSLLRTARVPFNVGLLVGTYFIGKGLLTPYYTSNWEWNIKTKNYEYSRRWQRPWYSDEQKRPRETISFPRQK